MRFVCAFFLALALLTHLIGAASEFDLTPQEIAWITEHPVIRVAVLDDVPPLEYLRDGKLMGISGEYLDYITRITGLQFSYVQASSPEQRYKLLLNNSVDLIAAVYQNGPHFNDPRFLHSEPYLNTTAVVITRTPHSPIIEDRQLNGLTITVPLLDGYAEVIKQQAPEAKLIVGGDGLTMLRQVAAGQANAAIASEADLLPMLYTEFKDRLQISGVFAEMVSHVGMTTLRDNQMLQQIIAKAFDALTAGESRLIYSNWLKQSAKDASLSDFISRYPREVSAVSLIVFLLCALLALMYKLHQRAVHNEQEKARFLAVMSHEIRSPLNAILAAVELLHNTHLQPSQRHFAELANTGAQSLLRLLNNVLDISKLDAGKLHLEPEPVDIAELIHQVVDLQRLRAASKNLYIKAEGDSQPPLLMLDSARLCQVLHNLISNALKFTEQGGVNVTYAISDTQSVDHKQLNIHVSDTGMGIAKEAQGRLFSPYVQAAQMYKRAGGAGLGLSICHDLITLMNGTITLSSEPGQGTQIDLSLLARLAPEGAVAEHEPAPTLPVSTPPATGLRVLVVEDGPANQAVLAAQLHSLGCTPVIARDAAQALQCFEQGSYALILMDCDLPDQDGYSLTQQLRQRESLTQQSATPIIAISASTDSAHNTRCFECGMDGVLNKPVSLAKLKNALELWCSVSLSATSDAPAQHQLDQESIGQALEADLHAILEAQAMLDPRALQRAAHRLRGAALSLDWQQVVAPSADLEALSQQTPFSSENCQRACERLVKAFRTSTYPGTEI